VLPSDGSPRIVGVDPANPDRIAVLIDQSSGADRILVSHDRGATLTPYLRLGEFAGRAFAPDGRVWIGGKPSSSESEQGVWAAQDLDSAPVRLAMADYPVQCLGYHAASAKLYACQIFSLGEVELASGAFTTTVSLAAVSDMVDCKGSQTAELCEPQLCGAYCGPGHFAVAPVCAAYDKPGCGVPVAMQEAPGTKPVPPTELDAGARSRTPAADSGGADASTAMKPRAKGSCGVVAVRGRDGMAAWWAMLAALCLRAARRRGCAAGCIRRRSGSRKCCLLDQSPR
jgi:hypothetical protein